MLKANFIGLFLFAFCVELSKTDSIEEFPATETLEYEFINTTTKYQNKKNLTVREINSDVEVGDVYDDYIKIHIFQGAEFRTAVKTKDKLWENGIVPYEISNSYRQEDRTFILNAMAEFHNKTCVIFQRRTNETSYISIMPGTGCSAVVGNSTRRNRVTLSENCFVKGIVLHELMHTLGFVHEHTRPDRDEFVQIEFDNIREGAEGNFDKYSPGKVETFNQSYDYGSVMHYGSSDFARDSSRPTIVPRQNGVEIGQRVGFSKIDVIKINLLYNCNGTQNAGNVTNPTKRNVDEKRDKAKVQGEVEEDKRNKHINRNAWRYYLVRLIFIG